MSSILKVDTIQDQAGNNIISEAANVITIGASGDTITVPAGATVSGFTSAGIDDNADATAITIDSSENVGIKNATMASFSNLPATDLVVGSGSTHSGITIYSSASSGSNIAFADGASGDARNQGIIQYHHNGDYMRFFTSASEKMRINSSGSVGIGTSSPGTIPLNVVSTDGGNVDDILELRNNSTTNGTGARLRLVSSTDPSSVPNSVSISSYRNAGSDHDILFESSGSEKMRIRSTGLVGIGTGSPSEQLDISSNSPRIRFSDTSVTNLRHVIGSEANDLEIRCDDGNVQATSHIGFKIDGSEKVRMTDTGRVGIGTSSPVTTLDVGGSLSGGQGVIGKQMLVSQTLNTAYSGASSGSWGGLMLNNNNSSTSARTATGLHFTHGTSGVAGIVSTSTASQRADIRFITRGAGDTVAERVIITDDGNVGIGKSDPTTALQVLGQISLITPTNGNGMSTNCIGTPANYSFDVRDDGAFLFRIDPSKRIQTNGGTNMNGHLNLIGERGQNFKAIAFEHSGQGGLIGNITTGSSSVAYNTSSDYRLKENIVEITDATTRLKQLKPKRFNFIKDADTTVDGFIAHEVSNIVPEAISGTKDAVQLWEEGDKLPDGVTVGDNKLDDDGNTIPEYQGIDQSKLVPLLVKTIQELEARITALETTTP